MREAVAGTTPVLARNPRSPDGWYDHTQHVLTVEGLRCMRKVGLRVRNKLFGVTEMVSSPDSEIQRLPKPLVVLIVFFGTLPPWLPITLHSMASNVRVSFVVVGDSPAPAVLPPNVHFEQIGFAAMQARLSALTGRTIRYGDTYKANDIKPVLPALYPALVSGYTWWAWADLDVVFGDLLGFFERAEPNPACCKGRELSCSKRLRRDLSSPCFNSSRPRDAADTFWKKGACACEHGEAISALSPLYPNPWRKKCWGPFTAFRTSLGTDIFRRTKRWREMLAMEAYTHSDEWWGPFAGKGFETMGEIMTRLSDKGALTLRTAPEALLSHPILSHPTASYPFTSHPIPSGPVMSRPVPSHPVPSHPIGSHPIPSHLTASHRVPPRPPRPVPPPSSPGELIMSKTLLPFSEAKSCADIECTFCPCGATRFRLVGPRLYVNDEESMVLHLAESKKRWCVSWSRTGGPHQLEWNGRAASAGAEWEVRISWNRTDGLRQLEPNGRRLGSPVPFGPPLYLSVQFWCSLVPSHPGDPGWTGTGTTRPSHHISCPTRASGTMQEYVLAWTGSGRCRAT